MSAKKHTCFFSQHPDFFSHFYYILNTYQKTNIKFYTNHVTLKVILLVKAQGTGRPIASFPGEKRHLYAATRADSSADEYPDEEAMLTPVTVPEVSIVKRSPTVT